MHAKNVHASQVDSSAKKKKKNFILLSRFTSFLSLSFLFSMRFVARGGKLKVKVKRFFFYFFGGGFNEISSSCVRFECNVLLCGLCVDGMILRSVFFLNDPLYSVRYSVPGRRKVGFQRLQLSNYRDNYETIGRRCAERDPLIGIHCSRSLLEMPMKCVSIRGSL